MSSRLKQLTKTEIQEFLDLSNSWSDLRTRIYNNKSKGSGISHLKQKITPDDFCFLKFIDNNKNRKKIGGGCKRKPLTENSSWSVVKRRFKEVTECKCTECGIGDSWNGKPITLQVDHIDGDNSNNDFSNLRYLCLNCHSQTHTWGFKRRSPENNNICECGCVIGKTSKKCRSCTSVDNIGKRRKVQNRPSKDELNELLKTNSFLAVGRMFGVSDNAIRKWLR